MQLISLSLVVLLTFASTSIYVCLGWSAVLAKHDGTTWQTGVCQFVSIFLFYSSLKALSAPLGAFSWNKNIPLRRCFLRVSAVVDGSVASEI